MTSETATGQGPVSVWILSDQLLAQHPALTAALEWVGDRGRVRVVLVESAGRLRKLPYQRKKLVLLLSAMRHYAAELATQGYRVEIVRAATMAAGLAQHVAACGSTRLFCMAAADYGGRMMQQGLARRLGVPVEIAPNTQMLVGRNDPFPQPGARVVMERFYRAMRRHFDLLMAGDQPVGEVWNTDQANRKPWPKRGLQPPARRGFTPDAMTLAVMDEVATLSGAVGTVDGFDLAVTREEAEAALEDFITHRLADFGPYEDAMSREHGVLFHAQLSPYLNLGLLDPLVTVQHAISAYHAGHAPLNSVEGFVRQIVGWREYMYWQYWRQMPTLRSANAWQHTRPMPQLFWEAQTDLACLHTVVQRVIDHGYTHHIERLMVICNFCMLAGIDPAQVNRWFWGFYLDAYEWVVTPNVIGMGLNADGGQTATKPYIASANYIHKMGDYCAGCRYQPKQRTGPDACPFNFLYWNFLLEHEELLRANPRFGPAVLGLKHLDAEARRAVQAQARAFLAQLVAYSGMDDART